MWEANPLLADVQQTALSHLSHSSPDWRGTRWRRRAKDKRNHLQEEVGMSWLPDRQNESLSWNRPGPKSDWFLHTRHWWERALWDKTSRAVRFFSGYWSRSCTTPSLKNNRSSTLQSWFTVLAIVGRENRVAEKKREERRRPTKVTAHDAITR